MKNRIQLLLFPVLLVVFLLITPTPGRTFLIVIAVFVIFFVYFIIQNIAKNLVALSNAEVHEVPKNRECDVVSCIRRLRPDISEWISQANCEYQGMFHFKLVHIESIFVVWNLNDESIRLMARFSYRLDHNLETAKECIAAFTTDFHDNMGIVTSSNRESNTIPSIPGIYVQSASNMSLDESLKWHREAVDYVANLASMAPKPKSRLTAVELEDEARRHMNYVRSLFLWRLRIPYWLLVRSRLRHGKPISKQSIKIVPPPDSEKPQWTREQQVNPYSPPLSE